MLPARLARGDEVKVVSPATSLGFIPEESDDRHVAPRRGGVALSKPAAGPPWQVCRREDPDQANEDGGHAHEYRVEKELAYGVLRESPDHVPELEPDQDKNQTVQQEGN